MHRYTVHKFPFLPHWGYRKLKGLYFTAVLRQFGSSLAGIFIPLYIFESFKSLDFSGAALQVVSYFLILEFVCFLAVIPIAKISLKIGWKRAVFLGNLFASLKLLLLIFARQNYSLFLPSAILWGLSIPFYWNFYHLVFIEKSEDGHRGEQISLVGILERLVGVVGPFLGGMIIFLFGFKPLLLISLFLIFFSSLPISLTSLDQLHPLPYLGELIKDFFAPDKRRIFLAIGARGALDIIAMIIWPLFIFLFLKKSFVSLGAITSFSLFLSLLILFIAGRLTDRQKKERVLSLGVISESLVWIVKGLVGSVYQVIFVDILDKVSHSFLWIPFTAIIYKIAGKTSGRFEFIVLREIALKIGNLAGLSSLAFLLYFKASWLAIFLLAAFWTLLSLIIIKRRRS